ncbi:MAG: peptidoglycan DD-metalloendopeptidase family protein [Deinococcaceae bacterium]
MNRSFKWVSIFLLLKGIVLHGVFAAPASVSTSPTLIQLQDKMKASKDAQKEQLARIDDLRRSVRSLNAKEQGLQVQLQTSGRKMAELENSITALKAKRATIQDQMRDVSSQIAVNTQKAERLRDAVAKLLLRLYQNQRGQYVRLIARAQTLHDAMVRSYYANRLGKHDLDLIAELKAVTETLQKQKAELEQLKNQLLAEEARLNQAKEKLQAASAIQQQSIEGLRKSKAGQNAILLNTLEAKQKTDQSIQDLVRGILAERIRLEKERQERLKQLEEERKRREAEQKRLAEERLRLAKLAALAREKEKKLQAEREQKAKEAAAQTERERRQAQIALAEKETEARVEAQRLKREQQAVRDREVEVERQRVRSAAEAQSDLQALRIPRRYSGKLGFPFPGGKVSSAFNGYFVLLSGGTGTGVTVTGAGTVLQASHYAAQGTVVVVQHSDNLISTYFCLQNTTIASGSHVEQGQVIGYPGGCPTYGEDTMGYQVSVIEGGEPVYVNPL